MTLAEKEPAEAEEMDNISGPNANAEHSELDEFKASHKREAVGDDTEPASKRKTITRDANMPILADQQQDMDTSLAESSVAKDTPAYHMAGEFNIFHINPPWVIKIADNVGARNSAIVVPDNATDLLPTEVAKAKEAVKAMFFRHLDVDQRFVHHFLPAWLDPSSQTFRQALKELKQEGPLLRAKFFYSVEKILKTLVDQPDFLPLRDIGMTQPRMTFFKSKVDNPMLIKAYRAVSSAVDLHAAFETTEDEKCRLWRQWATAVLVNMFNVTWRRVMHPNMQTATKAEKTANKKIRTEQFLSLSHLKYGLPLANQLPGLKDVPVRADFLERAVSKKPRTRKEAKPKPEAERDVVDQWNIIQDWPDPE